MSSIIEITDSSFKQKVINSELPVLLDFWAPWCGPCRALAPVLEEISQEYQDKIIVAKINIDNNQEIPAKNGIRSIPTLLLFKNGSRVEDSIVGALSKNEIKSFLDANI